MLKKVTILLIAFSFISVNAQSLEETLSKLSSTAGKAYVAPVISGFGSNLNSGWVSKLPDAKLMGFTFDLKIIAAGSFFTDTQQNFLTSGKFFFSSSQVDQILANSGFSSGQQGYSDLKNKMMSTEFDVSFSGPTIIGSESEYLKIVFPKQNVTANNQTFTVNEYKLNVQEVKGLLNKLSILPTPGIQLTVGTVFGTNVAVRYSPKIKISDDLGEFSLMGFGGVHNIGTWFPNPLPVDISVAFFTQKLKVGDVFESNASQMGAYVSKTFGFAVSFAPFAGIISETSNTKVTYDYQSNQMVNGVPVPKAKINFELDGENKVGYIVGFNIKLGLFNINADYKFSKTNTASAGISLGF